MRRITTCAWLLLLPVVSAIAHHNSSAAFDMENEVTIEGVVTRYQWKNPHLYFYVDATDEAGGSVEWRVEAGPLALMRRLGWSKETLSPGDKVLLTANPSRNPARRSAFMRTASSDDVSLPAFASEEAFRRLITNDAPADARTDGLSGTWVTILDPEVAVFVDHPERLALTDAGHTAIEAFDETTMHTGLDCIPMTAPSFMMIPDTKSIEIVGHTVTIRGEFDSAERTVYLTKRAQLAAPSIQGYSEGTLEDGVLTVETGGFLEHRMGNGFSLPSSRRKRLHEEFELAEDGASLTYRFWVEDAEYLAEPFEGEVTWAYRPDLDYEGLPCDRENARLFLSD